MKKGSSIDDDRDKLLHSHSAPSLKFDKLNTHTHLVHCVCTETNYRPLWLLLCMNVEHVVRDIYKLN